MNCRELTERLLEFLAGELEGDCCEQIRRHLRECPPCETYFRTYQITVTLSRNLPVREMSVTFAAKLREMMCPEEKKKE